MRRNRQRERERGNENEQEKNIGNIGGTDNISLQNK